MFLHNCVDFTFLITFHYDPHHRIKKKDRTLNLLYKTKSECLASKIEMAKKAQDNFLQSSILAQAGNAMTVNVMQEIGKSILEYLYE